MEKEGYVFYCSDTFQKPLKIEFIPKKDIAEPKTLSDFDTEVEGKKVVLEKSELINEADSLKYQKSVILISRFFWLAFAVAMFVLAFVSLKTANYKMIFFSIGALFLSILSDFVGTKLTFKKCRGQNIKLTLKTDDAETNVFILVKENEEDLKVLFPDFFNNVSKDSASENQNEEFD